MEKFWIVYAVKNSGTFVQYKTLAEATNEAKRRQANDRDNQFVIMQAVAVTEQPVPDIAIKQL